MFWKDFENLDARLRLIREESAEIFEKSERVFQEDYETALKQVFARDILWAKKHIKALFQIEYVDKVRGEQDINKSEIFHQSVAKVMKTLPLGMQEKQQLEKRITSLWEIPPLHLDTYHDIESFESDPYYPILEDLLHDQSISPEEFLLIKKWFEAHGNILSSLETLPENVRIIVWEDISSLHSLWESQWHDAFEWEYHSEIVEMQKSGINLFPVIRFVSRSYFRNPWKLRRKEHPWRRLRRTFKMALLRALRMKYGNIDAQKLMKQFDQCETFTEMMMLIYQLFEILWENDETKESFQVVEEVELIEKLINKAEDTKEKILAGEKVTAKVSKLISETDAQLEEWILEKILEDDTHFHGDEIHFAHEDDMAGIHAESTDVDPEDEEEEDDDVIDSGDTLQGNYESLKVRFQEVEEEKRKAFLSGEYDSIDAFNERLLTLQSKIEKVAKLLWEDL